MEWENNYFKVLGGERSLKIIQKTGGVVIVPRYLEQFLIIKIQRTDNKFHWEFPRGFTEMGEPNIVAVQRELKEELNIIGVDTRKDLGAIMSDSGVIDSHVHAFEVRLNKIDNIKLQHSEHIVDYKLVDFNTLCKMIKQNEIIDGFTISGLFKWQLSLGNRRGW